MDLATYRSTHGLTQSAIAELLVAAGFPTANQSLVSQWERGELAMSADWCVRLERVTGGVCTRLANRPDLFGDLYDHNAQAHEVKSADEGRDNNSG